MLLICYAQLLERFVLYEILDFCMQVGWNTFQGEKDT